MIAFATSGGTDFPLGPWTKLLKLPKEGQVEYFRFEDSTQRLTNPREMTRPINQLVD